MKSRVVIWEFHQTHHLLFHLSAIAWISFLQPCLDLLPIHQNDLFAHSKFRECNPHGWVLVKSYPPLQNCKERAKAVVPPAPIVLDTLSPPASQDVGWDSKQAPEMCMSNFLREGMEQYSLPAAWESPWEEKFRLLPRGEGRAWPQPSRIKEPLWALPAN